MRAISATKGDGDHGGEPVFCCRHRPEPRHQSLEKRLVGVMRAVADAHASRMSPDTRRQKQKLQPGRGQRSVAQRFHLGLLFPVEQHQPAVEVVSQHGELKVNAVHRPPSRRMSREPGIIFCFLNEILGARPLVIEPRQESNPAAYVGDEYAIAVFRSLCLAARLRTSPTSRKKAQGSMCFTLTPRVRTSVARWWH